MSIEELARNASGVIDQVAASGRPAIVTRDGAPVAAVVPIDEGELEDLVLARGAQYAAAMSAADADLAVGRTRPMSDLFDTLDTDS